MSFAIAFPFSNAAFKRAVSASYKKTCVFKTSAACFAIASSFPKAKSNNTSIEGPPFM